MREYELKHDALKALGVRGFLVDAEGVVTYADPSTAPSDEAITAKMAELQAAIPMARLRRKRDVLLAATDWWVLPDRTPTPEQLAYRQALRDITQSYSSVADVVWPVKPE